MDDAMCPSNADWGTFLARIESLSLALCIITSFFPVAEGPTTTQAKVWMIGHL